LLQQLVIAKDQYPNVNNFMDDELQGGRDRIQRFSAYLQTLSMNIEAAHQHIKAQLLKQFMDIAQALSSIGNLYP